MNCQGSSRVIFYGNIIQFIIFSQKVKEINFYISCDIFEINVILFLGLVGDRHGLCCGFTDFSLLRCR